MNRFVLSTVVLLTACAPERSAESYLNRNPALRTTQVGVVHQLDGATTADGSLGVLLASSAHTDPTQPGVAVVAFDGVALYGECDKLAVYVFEDAESGIREPRHTLDVCDGLGEVHGAHHGLLFAGTRLYRFDHDGIVEEADLGALIRSPFIHDATVVDADTVLAAADGLARTYTRSPTGWREADRQDLVIGDGAYAWESMLYDGAGTVYHHDGDGWSFAATQDVHTAWGPRWQREDRHSPYVAYLDADGDLESDRSQCSPFPLDRGYAMIDRGSVEVLDDDCNPLTRYENRAGAPAFGKAFSDGGRVLDWSSFDLSWIDLYSGDPVDAVLIDASFEVRRDETEAFTIEVPESTESLVVRLTGDGDGDLYVRRGEAPTFRTFDCSPYRMGSNEICTFDDPAPGTWHVHVVGFDPTSSVSLHAAVD